jgi:hypothetical protein
MKTGAPRLQERTFTSHFFLHTFTSGASVFKKAEFG